jgi:hypothetical protein
MFARLHHRLTYANVVATLALFIALGGTGYAALKLPRNSVGNGQIRAGAVTNSKLGAKSVSRTKLQRSSVTSTAVARNTLTGGDISEKTLGIVPGAARALDANRASRAATAADADRLQGLTSTQLQDRCPAATYYDSGGCIESATRSPATFVDASVDCTAGRRLPSASELLGYAEGHGGAGVELSSDLQTPLIAFTVNTSTHSIATTDTTATKLPFRCVALPLNAEPNINGG